MKKLIAVTLSSVCLFAACKKDPASPDTPPVNNEPAVITSVWVRDTMSHTTQIDSFTYDSNNRLSALHKIYCDSSVSPVHISSNECLFSYSGNDSLPVSATIGNDLHIFTYNSSRQIIKDSVTNLYTYYFDYGSDLLYTTLVLPPVVGTYKDTIRLQNNNIASGDYWLFSPGGSTHNAYSMTYSTQANPIYNLKNMGLLLYCLAGKNLDYISAKLPSSRTVNESFVTTNSWIASKGRVDAGVESIAIPGSQLNLLLNFYYK